MIYKKPENVKYTDMCIFIDSKVQEEGELSDDDATTVYEYLYHIIYMLAVKQRFFHKEEYYDEFAILTAGDVFNRLFTNPKLSMTNSDGSPKMVKVKSCLNYIKNIIRGRKVAYEQTNFSQKFIDIEQVEPSYSITPTMTSYSYDWSNLDFTKNLNLDIYLGSVTDAIKYYLNHNSPYRNNKQLMKNIYISCLLSILNAITFTEQDYVGVQTKYVSPSAKTKYIDKVYANNKLNCITLYHLPNFYFNYITVLVRQLLKLISNDIREMCKSSVHISEDTLISISLSEVIGGSTNDN